MECAVCNREKPVASNLKVCRECIVSHFEEAKPFVEKAFSERKNFGVPIFPPKGKGIKCGICANNCVIPENRVGYCGLSENKGGKLERRIGSAKLGLGHMYKDPHVTNCVASWCCAGGTGAGYPKYAKRAGPEIGYSNASVFLGSCSYFCLYCQNESWHEMMENKKPEMKAGELAEQILNDENYTCVCWFGGSPEVQAPFVFNVSKIVREEAGRKNRILRICHETNGNFSKHWLKKIGELSLESGGGIKFDLKTHSESLNIALSGISNKASYRNFEALSEMNAQRKEPPFLRASTLLVPGYIDSEEIYKIARFIAGINEGIPYSLLAFHPCFKMRDLPSTSWSQAEECLQAAKRAGLERVRIGNIHLLH